MPVKVQRWKCSVCGAAFAEEQEAKKCEDSHICIDEIKSQHYSLRSIAPSHLIVVGSDGRQYRYSLVVI